MELFGQIGNGSEDPAADPIALERFRREVETHFRVLCQELLDRFDLVGRQIVERDMDFLCPPSLRNRLVNGD